MQDMTVVEEVNRYRSSHIQKLGDSDESINECFGESVTTPTDGSILIVGESGYGSRRHLCTGSVCIYRREEGKDIYDTTPIQKLIASDGVDYDWFGTSVAVSADKSILIVGATKNAESGAKVGAVYIYRSEEGQDTYDSAHIQKITVNDEMDHDWFGLNVAISTDKNILTICTFTNTEDYDRIGAVYIYRSEEGVDTYNPTPIQKLTTDSGDVGDWFSASVSLSADKSILVVGSIRDVDGSTDAGSVYIYQQNVGLDTYNTAHIQKLTASDRATSDWFGIYVSLSADKSILIVGAHEGDDGGIDSGSVYIYKQT